MHEVVARLLSQVKAVWQYRWTAMGVAWAISVIGWVAVYFVPDRYEASARVYVDTQSMLKPLLSGLAVQPNVDQQVAMMSRTLISRPNVEKVIRMSDMDIKIKTNEEKDALIDKMISRMEIKSVGRDNLYSIAYQDKSPDVAKRVVQSFLTLFVEGSLGDKRKDMDSARRFLDEQIKAYEQKLVLAENALKEFKRHNIGLMPDQGKDYFSRFSEASGALDRARLELREAENGRDAIKNQLAGETPVLLAEDDAPAGGSPELDSRIQNLKNKLDGLRLNYTEQHPDIVATKRIIDQLEEQKKQEAKLKTRVGGTSHKQNLVSQQLSISLAEAEANVASMKARVAEYERRFVQMKTAANAVPQVEADLVQLNRDYEVNKSNYEKLLARRESAQISGDMESTASGVDFRVIDPPRVPPTPSAPNRPLLTSLVFLGGALVGIAMAFLRSQARPTFNDRKTLREVTGLPFLGAVSMNWTDAQKKKRKKANAAFTLSFLSLLTFYGAVMAALSLMARTA